MKEKRLVKRSIALSLVLVMIVNMFTGIKADACWSGDPEQEESNAFRYGLWLGDSWYGEYDDNGTRREDWLIGNGEGEMPYAEDVNLENMTDYWDIDLREVNGTITDKAFYFQYIPYERQKEEIVVKDTEPVTKASDLVITYLGEEFVNGEGNENNIDARWAKDTSQETDATIKPVAGKTGLFKINISEPGYYIISYGALTTDEEGNFENSDAAIHFHVYEYTGLAAREAEYNEDEEKWIPDSEQTYGNFFDCTLWGKAYAVTDVNEGQESSISLKDLELTYYGEIDADPRCICTKGENEEYYPAKVDGTNATLETYAQDSRLFLFTPDKPGEYLISKKGITDDINDDNRAIREQAIWIRVDANRACFFETFEKGYSGTNLLTTVWDNCYRPAYINGMGETQFYYRAAINGANKEEDTFERLFVWYGDEHNGEEISKASISECAWLSDVLSMEPVAENTGWYKITIKEGLQYDLNIEFIDTQGQNAYLNVRYFEPGQIDLRRVSRENTTYKYKNLYDDMYFVTVPFTADAYIAEEKEMKQITGSDLKGYKVYGKEEIFLPEESINEDGNGLYEGYYYDPDSDQYKCEDDAITFYPNATKPEFALRELDHDIASVSVSGDRLTIQVNAIGDYVLSDGESGYCDLRVDLPNLGVYISKSRKTDYYEPVDNWPSTLSAYEGRESEEMYVLGWVDNNAASEDREVDPWATDPETIEINAGKNVQWSWDEENNENRVDYTKLENFIRKGDAVKYENGIAYGYAITLTDAIDSDFSLIMSHERIGMKNSDEIVPGMDETHYDQLDVTFIPLKKINIKTAPTKVEYMEGSAFDSDGLVVEAVYKDGKTFTLTKEDYQISVGDKSSASNLDATDTAVTISYLGKTVNQTITVKEKTKVDLSNAAWNYKEAFTADGTEKTVEITGLPTDLVNVEYKNNKASAAGTYTAEAVITLKDASAYKFAAEIPASLKSLAWEIKPATVTVSKDPSAPSDVTLPVVTPSPVGTIVNDAGSADSTAVYTVCVKSAGGGETGKVAYTGETVGSTALSVVIPNTIKGSDGITYEVTQIANNALKDNKTIKKVTVGNKVTDIGANAFKNATNLTTVKLGKNVEKIGKNAFNGDKKLKSITIDGNSLEKVGKNAFKDIKNKATITINAKDKKTYNDVVKMIEKSGADNVKYKFKKKK